MNDISNFGSNSIGPNTYSASAFHPVLNTVQTSQFEEDKEENSEENQIQSKISIQARLNLFWQVTAPSVTRERTCDIDSADIGNPQQVAEFAKTISQHLLDSEQ